MHSALLKASSLPTVFNDWMIGLGNGLPSKQMDPNSQHAGRPCTPPPPCPFPSSSTRTFVGCSHKNTLDCALVTPAQADGQPNGPFARLAAQVEAAAPAPAGAAESLVVFEDLRGSQPQKVCQCLLSIGVKVLVFSAQPPAVDAPPGEPPAALELCTPPHLRPPPLADVPFQCTRRLLWMSPQHAVRFEQDVEELLVDLRVLEEVCCAPTRPRSNAA